MNMSSLEDGSDIGSRIVSMINLGMKVHTIGVDMCRIIPVDELIHEKKLAFCEGIFAEIFEAAGFRREQARQCWDRMVNRLMNDEFLEATTITNYSGRTRSLCNNIEETLALQAKTDKIACMPASFLASVIAAIAFQKLRPQGGRMPPKGQREFTRMFGDMKAIQWLPIAIRVWERTEGCRFIIEIDQEVSEPVLRLETWEGRRMWIVTTRKSDPNIYEAIFRDVITPNARDEEVTKPIVVPSDVCERPLSSVENDELSPSKLSLPSTPNDKADNDTLRECACEMKELEKQLSSPERATVKGLSRVISEFADHADQKHQNVRSERNIKESERKLKTGRKGMGRTAPKTKKPFKKPFGVYERYEAL
ncbi:hypothetical protein KAF25_010822 [Fusarium avenaceum]|uniref:Uncharacterized protein n=1 Tax=Fusarium avenaceum TaxID=40199 RepID=A0A9P7GXY3_9HYPO|nr:hypothetical protein KAF25_010822 [Fusarium avenaceum]